MKKPSRRSFLKAAAIGGLTPTALAMNSTLRADDAPASPAVITEKKLNVACIGVGGKGDSDSNHAAAYGNVVAICDVDRGRLAGKGKKAGFEKAKQYTDFRELLEKHEKEIDIVTVSTPDHAHTAATLMAMRMGKHVYTQKPLTRTIYEARKLAEVAKEKGVCTQMGNQGTALDSSRRSIAQIKAGVIGTVTGALVWSNRPVWGQGPGRRNFLEKFAREGYEKSKDNRAAADKLIWAKFNEIQKGLENLDWKNWIATAPYREYFPGLYHSFQWRGWWDFGSGALGDMACHHCTVPFAAAGLKDPLTVQAKTSGHDYDSFPASSTIKFEFPETSERGPINFWWLDREGNKPTPDIFDYAKYKFENLPPSGTVIFGEKGIYYSKGDYGQSYDFIAPGGEKIAEKDGVDFVKAVDKGDMDKNQMYELFRAVEANDPKICVSNFVDRAGPMTETILLGNLAVWAAAQGGENGAMGEWGEKVEWDAKNLVVKNLADLKTPGVADLIKPVYSDGYILD